MGSPTTRSSACSRRSRWRPTTSAESERSTSAPRRTRRSTSTPRRSSEIVELMKRPDERAVVEKAHRRPRFVEDCVREMVRGVVNAYPDLDETTFVLARQRNLETIHQHTVIAERHGLIGEIRVELDSDRHSRHHVTMREWLERSGS